MKMRPATAGLLFCASAIVFAAVVLFSSRREREVPRLVERSKSTPAALAEARRAAPPKVSFNDRVQPILSEHCFHCHGPDSETRKGELRLDRAEFAFAIRKEGGVAIAKGDPENSLLMRRVTATDPAKMMPPEEAHKPLKPEQVAVLRQWIEEGAEYQEHWAFVKLEREPLPDVKNTAWPRNPIDRFVLAKLEAAGFSGAPAADKHALLRRVTFDLTGLPPTPAEIGDFIADASNGAYERVVDRLLASVQYGEHRARYWLDAVRYGDTNGEHADNLRTSWPYRDYVIDAFNTNKPFDQFVIEQLAGDLLPPKSVDQLVATQFNRLHTTTNEGGSAVEEIYLHKLKDRTQTTSAVFLGLTIGCAACHDHKFDPIPQEDFYKFAAFFNNMPDSVYDGNQAVNYPTVTVPKPENRAEADRVLSAKAAVEQKLLERTSRAPELIAAWISSGEASKVSAISPDKLHARFRFDEADGNVVRNSAPEARPVEYALEGDDQMWGGSTRPVKFWTGLRFGVRTALKAEGLGGFDREDAFTVGGWFLPRERSGTTSGSFVSRMSGGEARRGWDLFWQNAPNRRPAAASKKKSKANAAKPSPAPKAIVVEPQVDDEDVENRPEPEGFLVANLVHQDKKDAITVRSKRRVSRKEWVHLAFSYDGSGKAAGVKLYIDGKPQEVDIVSDTLTGTIATSAPLQIARRTGSDASPETSFQDVRIYARALGPEEIGRMPHEDLAAEVLRRPMTTWSLDERKLVADWFIAAIDEPAIALRAEIARLDLQFQRATAGGVTTLISKERDSRPVGFVLNRGAYTSIKHRVEADVPAVLPRLPAGAPRNRLTLARWLVAPENPLTARVTVNRMWQELFGTGIVDTPENFGTVGSRPSHRQLLDWLAADFQESGWDVKRLYKQMMMSATYRQSAKIPPELLTSDPNNRLLGRGPRFRLDAEMLRDQALAASELLVQKVGGPSVRPYQVEGIWEGVAVKGQSNTRDYVQDKGDALYRRSVYTFWKRAAPNPVLGTFDAPKRDVCTLKRDRTNTPLQALVTENATDYLEAARHLAAHALRSSDTGPDQKIDLMALRLLGRPLPATQRQILRRSLEQYREQFANVDDARAFLAVGDSPVDATLPPAEFAAWTLLASTLVNSDQALNK
jgi:hypothetical protein